MKSFEARSKRAKAVADARAILDRATDNGEYRALSAEDKAIVDAKMEEANTLDELIEKLESIEKVEANSKRDDDEAQKTDTPVEMDTYKRRAMPIQLEKRDKASKLASPEYRKLFHEWMRTGQFNGGAEYRDVTISPNSAGGYLVTPTKISDDVVMAMNNFTFIRDLARIDYVTDAQALGVRQMTTQPSDAAWTTEIGNVSADNTMAFGRRDLTPQLLTKLINVSIKTLQLSTDVESLINDRLAYKFAVSQENAFLNGSGSGQPLGVFTADANGINTDRDFVVSTSGDKTDFNGDLLVQSTYQVKQQYLQGNKVAWIFHRNCIANLRTLKDSYGRYLWVDGGGLASAPSTLLGVPVKISEYAPSVLGAGDYVGILGNWDYYRIAQVRDLQIQRLVELYAGTNEVGFLGRMFVDASCVLSESFVRLQFHA